jgi:hypothetical protein
VLRLKLFALGDAAVAGVYEYNIFFTVQQNLRLCDVVLIGSSARKSMNQARLSVCPNVRFQPEVPRVTFLGLVHLWVTLTRVVLSGARSCDQSGIIKSSSFEQQAPVDQLGVHCSKNLNDQVVGFKQVTESEDGALIRQARGARVERSELTKQGHVVKGLFHCWIRQVTPLLQKWMRSIVAMGKGGRPISLSGVKGWIKPVNSVQRTTRFISSRNSRLGVNLVTNSNPVEAKVVCFINI